ncbi:hypothetical protein WP50_26690 [Lactiplantibacillus plantarum]|nr:hypothetical protein WP50_26690 [Lactiplantibacillus plantarum]
MQRVLPPLMDDLTTLYQLTEDQQIGLFVHLGSHLSAPLILNYSAFRLFRWQQFLNIHISS